MANGFPVAMKIRTRYVSKNKRTGETNETPPIEEQPGINLASTRPDATSTDSQKERLKKTLKSSVRRFWKPIKGGKKGTLSTRYGQVEVPKPEGD